MEKILMVEDDVQLRETLAEILQAVGYTVSQAKTERKE
jgi:DNA-binding response OmpR family regulator